MINELGAFPIFKKRMSCVVFSIAFYPKLIFMVVLVYFFLDSDNRFLLGFYGFNIHVWFGLSDVWGTRQGFWGYPYQLTPFIPSNLSLDATLIPVVFMFVYQWTLKNNKNFYLYTVILSFSLSFIFKPVLNASNLFELHKGTNYMHLFLFYCGIFLFAKMITTIFINLPKLRSKTIT